MNSQLRLIWPQFVVLTACLLTGTVAAAAAPAVPSVPDLIKQLDDDAFARREEASRQLAERGIPAIPELASAAQQRNAEVSTRAFAVLKKFVVSDDETLRARTREALKKISAKRETAEKNRDDTMATAADTASAILGRPFIGLFGMGAENATVGGVVKNSPAEKAGCRAGDVILSLGNVPTPTFQDLIAAVGKQEPGDQMKLQVVRNGEKMTLSMTIGCYNGLPLETVPEQPTIELDY